jgi:hypothetical protein
VKPEFPGYSEGYQLAMKRGDVFVVYVGCRGSHPIVPITGAVIAVQDTVPGYAARTIVVGYPAGNQMIEDVRLTCEQVSELNKAVEAARKKVTQKHVTPAKTTPQPLDWQIRSFPGALGTGLPVGACVNGACPVRR